MSANLTDSPVFTATNTVSVPTNDDPALADRFYTGANVGIQALINRTQWLLQTIQGTGATGAGTPGDSSGVMRIRRVTSSYEMKQIANAQVNDLCILEQSISAFGIYSFKPSSHLHADGLTVINSDVISNGQWVHINRYFLNQLYTNMYGTERGWDIYAFGDGVGVTRVRWFDNIANLKYSASRLDGDIVLLRNGNNISGLFVFVSASTATADDVNVIKPDDVTLPDPGRWISAWAGARGHNNGLAPLNSVGYIPRSRIAPPIATADIGDDSPWTNTTTSPTMIATLPINCVANEVVQLIVGPAGGTSIGSMGVQSGSAEEATGNFTIEIAGPYPASTTQTVGNCRIRAAGAIGTTNNAVAIPPAIYVVWSPSADGLYQVTLKGNLQIAGSGREASANNIKLTAIQASAQAD